MKQAALDIGRVVLASLFILGGLNKVMDAGPTITRMAEIGIPWPTLAIFGVIGIELGLGLVVAIGAWLKTGLLVSAAATLLIAHTGVINVLFHPFWAFDGQEAATELSLFFKNVSIIGGLAIVAAIYWPTTALRTRKG